MPYRDHERKRAYDRERMMRLWYEDQTWWQQHGHERWVFDMFPKDSRSEFYTAWKAGDVETVRAAWKDIQRARIEQKLAIELEAIE